MKTLRLQYQMGTLAIIDGDGYKLIEYYIPDYSNYYWGTQKGKELELALWNFFALQGYTHVQLDSDPLITIQEFIQIVQNNHAHIIDRGLFIKRNNTYSSKKI